MLRSLRSFPPAFLHTGKFPGARPKKSIQFLPIGEKELRSDAYEEPTYYEDLTLRYL